MTRRTKEIRQKLHDDISNLAYFTKVYKEKKNNIEELDLPAVCIIMGSGVPSGDLLEIDLSVRVEIHDKRVNINDLLDDHAEKLETDLLVLGYTMDDLIEGMLMESFDYSKDEQSTNGVLGLNYNVKYGV